MLSTTGVLPCAVRAVTPSLLQRAIALRWGVLKLCWGATNVFVLADGCADGLPCGARLEMYGEAARLLGDTRAFAATDLAAITSALKTAADDTRGCGAAVAVEALRSPLSAGAVAEWRITSPQEGRGERAAATTAPPLIMESGIVYESPQAVGPRVLSAARQTFARLVLRDAVRRQHPEDGAVAHASDALAILDVSDVDCAFSRVAVHVGVEAGLELERDFHVSYVPLTRAAAEAAGEVGVAGLLRVVAHKGGTPQPDPLRLLQSRYFALGCYTVNRCAKRGKKEHIGIRLAHVISKIHSGGALILNFLGNHFCNKNNYELQATGNLEKRDEKKEIMLLMRDCKESLTEALSRGERWGVIIDEVLPAADCRDASASLVVLIE